jgi:hypothetical protein
MQQAMARLHVLTSQGVKVSGAAAFTAIGAILLDDHEQAHLVHMPGAASAGLAITALPLGDFSRLWDGHCPLP